MTGPVLEHISIADLDPHPDNPRIAYREDVVESIRVSLEADGFSVEHALKVRPLNGRYQIVSGHQRTEAARLAGVETVPAWVRERSDEDAFMDLVRDNAQGELSPLEYGMHALASVPTAQGQDGGGLTAYAATIGKTQAYMSQLRDAAEVYSSLHNLSYEVADKAKHLYEISKAPRDKWQGLVHALDAHKWNVAQVREAVEKIKSAERDKLERTERIKAEEIEAKAFIEETAPDLAAQVGDVFESYAEAQAVWSKRNREEAARIAREKAEKEQREKEQRSARSDLYSGILTAIGTCAAYGKYEDIPNLMADYNPAELMPHQLERHLSELESAQRLIVKLIEWRDL